jgi:cutinase
LKGTICGPQTSNGLKSALGATKVATEGIEYAAGLSTNFLPGGADLAGIATLKSQLSKANRNCPNSKVVVAGYRYCLSPQPLLPLSRISGGLTKTHSQGAALVHRAIEDASTAVKNQIVGVVTYGDTQNQQDRGKIPNFPAEKVKVICNTGDLVCVGTLTILAPHLDYTRRAPEGAAFLVSKINGS